MHQTGWGFAALTGLWLATNQKAVACHRAAAASHPKASSSSSIMMLGSCSSHSTFRDHRRESGTEESHRVTNRSI